MKSRPQNPEFKNNPESFYPCTKNASNLTNGYRDIVLARQTDRRMDAV